jgi:DNA-binding MarR family transcriptional regulator
LNSDNSSDHNKLHYKAVGAKREAQRIWRMEQVLKYASLGYNQAEIAEVLHISQSWVSRTINAITKAAQQDIKRHIEETLPYERKKALTLFENVKKQALDIANDPGVGKRDKVSALALAKDAGKEIWALNSQGEHVRTALNVAAGLEEKLDNLQKEEDENREELPLYDHEP